MSQSPYQIADIPLGQPRPIRVIGIGAGASGINLARQIDLRMQNVDYVVYEKNSDVGGTWFENTYPGCTCDLPSHNYQYTWEPNPNWTKFYSPQSEILDYFRDVCTKHNLYRNIRLKKKVTGATWNEVDGRWNIEVLDSVSGEVFTDWCNVLVNGSGILNHWKWPEIPGLHDFEGSLMHTAHWDSTCELKGKRVAVIGSGSSGVQVVPAIQPYVDKLVTFVRSPTWITAGYAQNHAGPNGMNFAYSEQQKADFRDNGDKLKKYRKVIESELNNRFSILLKDTPEQIAAREYSRQEMRTRLQGDEKLIGSLVPEFPVGCRRSTPGNGYLEALMAENVRVVTEGISHVTPHGMLLSSGEVIDFDIIICATGFDLSFRPRFPVLGRNGASLQEQWTRSIPQAYMSLAVENFPNYFLFLGPNAPIGHGSVLPIAEHATKYMINVMKKMQTQEIKSFVPKPDAVRDFNEHIPAFMGRSVWSARCSSWYKNGKVDGPVVGLHPGSRIHWFHMLEDPRYEDYDYTYWTSNRFHYLGNGFSTREEKGKDTAWYLDEPAAGFRNY